MSGYAGATGVGRGLVLELIFEHACTRHRVSAGARRGQLVGGGLVLSLGDTKLGGGEPLEVRAGTVASMVDIVMIRTFGHDIIERFSAASSVPVIHRLTHRSPAFQPLG